jgi:NADH-quinone oxidoreductase subunit M
MGIVMLGMATLTEQGLNGAVFQMVAHGIMTGLFFALVGLVYEKAHSREIFKMGGFATMMPAIATAFVIGGLSSLGLPATAGFVAEFLAFVGAWQSAHSWWLIPAVIGAFLTSIYVLRVVRQIFFGTKSEDPHFQNLPDAQGTEWVAIVLLVGLIVLFGVLPSLLLKPIDSATVPLLMKLGMMR